MVLGCSGSGVIGGGRELESGPGLSVLASNCEIESMHTFAFSDKQACGKDATPESLAEAIGADPEEYQDGLMLVFIDPLTVSTEYALSMLDSVYPSVMKFGALVSGGHEYGENRMFFGDELRHHGAVGLLMKQNFDADTIVSGSEEPVGPSMVITKSSRNEIYRLDDRTPMSDSGANLLERRSPQPAPDEEVTSCRSRIQRSVDRPGLRDAKHHGYGPRDRCHDDRRSSRGRTSIAVPRP